MSASRSPTGCPCSGCHATRVLADVEAQIRAEARMAIRHIRAARTCYAMATNADDRAFGRSSAVQATNGFRSVMRIRRAARGGRDGGEST